MQCSARRAGWATGPQSPLVAPTVATTLGQWSGTRAPSYQANPHTKSAAMDRITALSGLNSVLTAPGGFHKDTGKHIVPKGSTKG